ncbi:MAG: nitric-oxide reductase large subunit, partial [Candidatus Acidiferrales bacterium]
MMSDSSKRELLVSSGWMQAVAIVMLCGFLILGMLAYRTYTDEPPIPQRVVDPSGQVIFTGEDITAGQEVFLRNGLMEYGSIFGHGAYLGPDFTADYLHRAALISIDHYGGETSESAK